MFSNEAYPLNALRQRIVSSGTSFQNESGKNILSNFWAFSFEQSSTKSRG
jgi:hypothetical protein